VLQKKKPTAVLLVAGFSGLGIHSLLNVIKLFPRYFVNVVFMSVGRGGQRQPSRAWRRSTASAS